MTSESHWSCCSIYDDDGERELQCPKCGCFKLVFEFDVVLTEGHDYLGKKASCFECGHRFTITENCWQAVYECD